MVLSASFFLLCGLRGHGHVPGWTCVTGWQSWHKNSPLANLCIKTNKWSRRKSLLKDQRPNWIHISSWNDGRFTDPADQHSLSQNRGEWGAESWKCEAEICERRVQCARTQRYESHCCCKGCASRLYSTDGGTRRKFLSPFLHYSFFEELYHMPSPWSS